MGVEGFSAAEVVFVGALVCLLPNSSPPPEALPVLPPPNMFDPPDVPPNVIFLEASPGGGPAGVVEAPPKMLPNCGFA